ncbi:response regulator [Candidatus Sumerlaeota bacterium]|nr:response regulator [Candidatus Sumerlaeota bacterium]
MAHILIADDEREAREIIRKILERAGHGVTEASGGEEALRILRGGEVDLCILDILMPDKDGLEVIREVRKRMPDLRILAISGGGRQGSALYLSVAEKTGMAKALPKPFSAERLLSVVQELLEG